MQRSSFSSASLNCILLPWFYYNTSYNIMERKYHLVYTRQELMKLQTCTYFTIVTRSVYTINVHYKGQIQGLNCYQVTQCDDGVPLHPLFMQYSNGTFAHCCVYQYQSLFFQQSLYVPFNSNSFTCLHSFFTCFQQVTCLLSGPLWNVSAYLPVPNPTCKKAILRLIG